jgi:prolipoprotein diacylglyceryltransferase
LWGRGFHPHIVFETSAYVLATCAFLYLRRHFGDSISTPIRWVGIAVAVAGATVGSKLLFLLEDPSLSWRHLRDPAYLMGGKTIVGALLFGLISVEAAKRYLGVTESTGDLYAIPLALGIAIGRVGCFLTGLDDNTFGTPSTLPWAIDFGDGIRRHPTQLYEAAFLIAIIPVLYWIMRQIGKHSKKFRPGDAFRFFMVSYMFFRLFCDFIKPYPRILFGLGGIQWACVLILLYYAGDVARWARERKTPHRTQESAFGSH